MPNDINKANEQLVLLNDALTSLNANIKATFKSQADTLSDASKTISSDFSKGIDQANKSLNKPLTRFNPILSFWLSKNLLKLCFLDSNVVGVSNL